MKNEIAQIEGLFKALADQTRLRILGLLLTGEVCVCHIHESLGIPQSKASRHLAYLRRTGLVETRREGVWIYYRMADSAERTVKAIEHAVRHVLGHVGEVRQDVGRLQKKTGCCLPTSEAPVLSCCDPSRLR
jgi:ArsR family transcriptional regulator